MHLSTRNYQGFKLRQDTPFTWSLFLTACWLYSILFQTSFLYLPGNMASNSSLCYFYLFTQSAVVLKPDYMTGTVLGISSIIVTRKMSAFRELMISWNRES